jgi:hypothetical protein
VRLGPWCREHGGPRSGSAGLDFDLVARPRGGSYRLSPFPQVSDDAGLVAELVEGRVRLEDETHGVTTSGIVRGMELLVTAFVFFVLGLLFWHVYLPWKERQREGR